MYNRINYNKMHPSKHVVQRSQLSIGCIALAQDSDSDIGESTSEISTRHNQDPCDKLTGRA